MLHLRGLRGGETVIRWLAEVWREYFRPLALAAWAVRYAHWWLRAPGYRMGDPSLGAGEMREHNRAALKARYAAQEPKRP